MKIIALLLGLLGIATSIYGDWEKTDVENYDSFINERIETDEYLTEEKYENEWSLFVPYKDPGINEINLHLYQIDGRDEDSELSLSNIRGLKNIGSYNKLVDNVFIIHDVKQNYKDNINKYIKNAIFDLEEEVNIFVVDWSNPAKYLQPQNSVKAVQSIGRHIANYINLMMNEYGIPSNNFRLVGYGVGAHIAGRVGDLMNEKPDYIIGLDPFKLGFSSKYLTKQDAKFVQVIHTNAGGIGLNKNLGHADYFVNNGFSQPGCKDNKCSHEHAWKYYVKSIKSNGLKSMKCENFKNFREGRCSTNKKSFLGGYNIDTSASGTYYLTIEMDKN